MNIMKILVVNGSPRGEQGNTEILVKAFLEGAREIGAESETIYLKDKRINHCVGCFACWFKTPGVCVHKDDMPEILTQILDADIMLLATPLYVYSVTGLMKDFMDRLVPLAQPFVDMEDGLCNHPPRYPSAKLGAVMLISNSGFPEQQHFTALKLTFQNWIRGGNLTLAGMICCAGGAVLQVPQLQDTIAWYIDATRQAGREVAKRGLVADETQSALDRPLIADQQMFVNMMNAHFRSLGVERIDFDPR